MSRSAPHDPDQVAALAALAQLPRVHEGPSAHLVSVTRLLDAARACGVSDVDVVRRAGLPLAVGRAPRLAAPTELPTRLPMSQVFTVWDSVARMVPPKRLLPKLMDALVVDELGPLGYATLTAPDLLSALKILLGGFALLTDSGFWSIEATSKEYVFAWHRTPHSTGQCVANEAVLAHFIRALSTITGHDVAIQRVTLRHGRRADQAFGDLARSAVYYDAQVDSISIARSELDAPPYRAHPGMHQHFATLARAQLEARRLLPDLRMAEQVRRILESGVGLGDAKLGTVCSALGISERTLHRRLLAEQTSFSEQLDTVRKTRAMERVLLTDHPMLQIALELGFSDASAFSRAFRRWFGKSATEVRARSAR